MNFFDGCDVLQWSALHLCPESDSVSLLFGFQENFLVELFVFYFLKIVYHTRRSLALSVLILETNRIFGKFCKSGSELRFFLLLRTSVFVHTLVRYKLVDVLMTSGFLWEIRMCRIANMSWKVLEHTSTFLPETFGSCMTMYTDAYSLLNHVFLWNLRPTFCMSIRFSK